MVWDDEDGRYAVRSVVIDENGDENAMQETDYSIDSKFGTQCVQPWNLANENHDEEDGEDEEDE